MIEKYYEDYEKPAKIYSGLTGVCLILDLISTLVLLGNMGSSNAAPTEADMKLGPEEYTSGALYVE